MRQKWLDALSDEARNKLSSAEKKFALRYNLLIAVSDLALTGVPAALPAAAPKTLSAEAAQPSLEIEEPAELSRKSLAEMEADEARHLEEVAARKRKDS